MKKIFIYWFAIVLLCSCGNGKDKWQGIISEKDNEIEELENRISELEEQVEELEDEKIMLENEKEELKDQLDDAEDIIQRAKSACFIWDDDVYMIHSILSQY